jgi:hypothetical protein
MRNGEVEERNKSSIIARFIKLLTLRMMKDALSSDTNFVHWGHNSNDANTTNAELGKSTFGMDCLFSGGVD